MLLVLLVISKANHTEFQEIKEHFIRKWDPRKGTHGDLCEVLIINNSKLEKRFQNYLSTLPINTVSQYYHGTSLSCAIHETNTPCSDETCGICGISQNGFLKKCIGNYFQRFGNGFYLAPNSSKSHDYTKEHKKYRAMLLCNVAEGNKYITKQNKTDLSTPPQGYNSVYGKGDYTDIHFPLNYDEIVLYTPEAILPTHILVYKMNGIN